MRSTARRSVVSVAPSFVYSTGARISTSPSSTRRSRAATVGSPKVMALQLTNTVTAEPAPADRLVFKGPDAFRDGVRVDPPGVGKTTKRSGWRIVLPNGERVRQPPAPRGPRGGRR